MQAAVLRGLSHPRLLRYIGFLYNKGKDLHIITGRNKYLSHHPVTQNSNTFNHVHEAAGTIYIHVHKYIIGHHSPSIIHGC